MKQRVLAIVGAVALVVIAVVAKGTIRGEDNSVVKPRKAKPTVACTPDLADVCDALAAAGTIAPDPPTLELDAAKAPADDIDGWITWDPAPRIANYRAGTSGPAVWDDATAVGSADLALLSPAGTPTGCGATRTWACLLKDFPTTGLGSIGIGSPATAEGLARILPLAKAMDPEDTNTVATAALQAFVDGRWSPQAGQADAPAQVDTLALQGSAAVGSVIGPVDLLTATQATPRGGGLRVWRPTKATPITIVVAPRQGRDLDDLADQIAGRAQTALADHGAAGDPAPLMDDDLAGFLYQVGQKVG